MSDVKAIIKEVALNGKTYRIGQTIDFTIFVHVYKQYAYIEDRENDECILFEFPDEERAKEFAKRIQLLADVYTRYDMKDTIAVFWWGDILDVLLTLLDGYTCGSVRYTEVDEELSRI